MEKVKERNRETEKQEENMASDVIILPRCTVLLHPTSIMWSWLNR